LYSADPTLPRFGSDSRVVKKKECEEVSQDSEMDLRCAGMSILADAIDQACEN